MKHSTSGSRTSLGRRGFLGLLASAALMAASRGAAGSDGGSKVKGAFQDSRGTTLYLELEQAPFPSAGAPYRDATVIVFVPSHYRVPRGERVDVVVHFHGHSTTAERAMQAHELREQLYDSKQNAILVVPQGPVYASDSSCGKLEQAGGLARLLEDLRATLLSSAARDALGPSALTSGAHIGTVCISAHSGGYHAAASCLRHGGVDVSEVYLFDALYNEAEVFRDWVLAAKGNPDRTRHKLVSYYAGAGPTSLSRGVLAQLEKAGVHCAHEITEGSLSRAEITRAQAVFIRTGLSHGGVTHELNALRDCLFASGLQRHLRSAWFTNKGQSRRLEPRRSNL